MTDALPAGHCAIDFGTSNSAVALPGGAGGVRLVALEGAQPTMPTAVFYLAEGPAAADEPARQYGRAALAAYVDGLDGRLMRSMKSILGSTLIEQRTDVGGGRAVRYLDVIAGYLRHLKQQAEAAAGGPIARVVIGRPVFFVDDDPARDARAQAALQEAAQAVGFDEVVFQYEPIAAALDHERTATREELVLVADIGGGTSDFALVRVGPQRRRLRERKGDILASHGVHLAGTDFDRHLELGSILPLAGYRALGPAAPGRPAREVPSRVYHDLATWHLINTVYAPARVAELRGMREFYADARQHARLMTIVGERLGHHLAAQAEAAKIELSARAEVRIDLSLVERGLGAALQREEALAAIDADLERIAQAARATLRLAGVAPQDVQALYLTGGSTALPVLAQRLAQVVPAARAVQGERFASVAQGLGEHARRVFGG